MILAGFRYGIFMPNVARKRHVVDHRSHSYGALDVGDLGAGAAGSQALAPQIVSADGVANGSPMKDFWTEAVAALKPPFDPTVPVVVKRFVIRLAILIFFAALPLQHGMRFAEMFFWLTAINALGCSVVALFKRDKFRTPAMTHWDEAVAMLLLCAATGLFLV